MMIGIIRENGVEKMAYKSPLTDETLMLAKKIEEKVKPYFNRVDEMAFYNQQKVFECEELCENICRLRWRQKY